MVQGVQPPAERDTAPLPTVQAEVLHGFRKKRIRFRRKETGSGGIVRKDRKDKAQEEASKASLVF